MADDLDAVKGNIRACIVSCKGGSISVRDLIRDYRTMIGGEIPYRKFNYTSLNSFLQSLPSLTVSGSGSEAIVQAYTDSASSHISSMIARQKTTKKRTGPPPRRGGFSYSSFRGNRGRGGGRGWYPPPMRSYPPSRENMAPRRQSPEFTPPPRRAFPEHRPDPPPQSQAPHTPLYVKVDENDQRQVSVRESSSQRDTRPNRHQLPPRLQKKLEESGAVDRIQNNQSSEQCVDENELSDLSALVTPEVNNKIISPLGPSQLIAASRARQQAVWQNNVPLVPVDNNIQLPEPRPILTTSAREFQAVNDIIGSVPVQVPQPNLTNIPHNVILLLQYARARGWDEPDYKLLPCKIKSGHPLSYVASVRINENGQIIKYCSSVPNEDKDVNVAKGYAAKVALEELLIEQQVIPVNTKQNSTDKSVICLRVSEIVAGVYNGLFCKRVEDLYIDKYNERLPDDWIQCLDSCPTVAVELGVNSKIIVPRSPATDHLVSNDEMLVPTLSLSDLPFEIIDVYVTHVTSTGNVWFRLIGEMFSDKYAQLSSEMEIFYKEKGLNEIAFMINDGHHYAAQIGEEFFRVRVSDHDDNRTKATAFMIDQGESEEISFTNLYRMPEQFYSLPGQALQCSLDGLEDFSELPCAFKVLSEHLVGKSLIAEVIPQDDETGCIRAVLHDTSGTHDVNLNKKILEEIFLNGHPVLPMDGCVNEVHVTSISPRGDVFVQVPNGLYEHVIQVLDRLSDEDISCHKLTSYRQVVVGKLYLARYAKDKQWYRAVVTAQPNKLQNMIAVLFIDFGNAETVSITDIAEVDKFPPILSKLPPQAVKVDLYNLPTQSLSAWEIGKLHSLLWDIDKTVFIKTIKLQGESPVVEIFSKIDEEAVVSVNNTILLYSANEQRIQKTISYDVNSHRESLNINGHDLFYQGLDRPKLKNDSMSVYVTLAASPGHFSFTLAKHGKELDNMMLQMQAYYDATAFPELTKADIKKGGVYAGKFNEEAWYRFSVTSEVMIGASVAVRFCDFGDVVFIPLAKMRDLQHEFRELPYMAVKGKLAGVTPAHTDWSVEDCLRFQGLVMNVPLSAKVVEIEDKRDDPMEMVVALELYDIRQEENISIAQVLINENRAVKDNN